MQVERIALARAYHKQFCMEKDTCDGTPDEEDLDLADGANAVLESVPAEAIIL